MRRRAARGARWVQAERDELQDRDQPRDGSNGSGGQGRVRAEKLSDPAAQRPRCRDRRSHWNWHQGGGSPALAAGRPQRGPDRVALLVRIQHVADDHREFAVVRAPGYCHQARWQGAVQDLRDSVGVVPRRHAADGRPPVAGITGLVGDGDDVGAGCLQAHSGGPRARAARGGHQRRRRRLGCDGRPPPLVLGKRGTRRRRDSLEQVQSPPDFLLALPGFCNLDFEPPDSASSLQDSRTSAGAYLRLRVPDHGRLRATPPVTRPKRASPH